MRNEVNADLTGIECRDANGAGGFERTAFQDAFLSSPREARKAENRQIFQDSCNHFLSPNLGRPDP